MNLLLFEASELDADQLSLTDHRAKHIRSVLKLKIGDTLRVGMLNSKMGQARVVQLDSSVV
ncbi:MAG: 16S rRNA (uracil(1498)-N(3))-methyltransferase, partial [Candidatus Electrothrix sp. ATG2]|nr:16S rRNA (uracil(1498)-N(3))-methyltransferase [Candidatus Electrothrix sp. ATG2]